PHADSFAAADPPGTSLSLTTRRSSDLETAAAGYTASYSAECTGTIALGQTKTCTVTNDDIQPKLIVIKHVINDNGGTKTAADFTMAVTGGSPSPASFAGAETPGTSITLNAGSYSVSESGPSGYASNFSADCTGSIAAGQTKTCTITNDDQAPHLIIIKNVVNDSGGTRTASDFSGTISGVTASGDNNWTGTASSG